MLFTDFAALPFVLHGYTHSKMVVLVYLMMALLQLYFSEPLVLHWDKLLSKNIGVKIANQTIKYLPARIFCHEPHIDKVHFIQCKMPMVSADAFQCLSLLNDVRIQNSSLRNLPAGVFRFNHAIRYMKITGKLLLYNDGYIVVIL